ncbi:ESPR domain-containing protein, partial [Acinetobacter sp.]|uniref:beta strand repeat-containing protein n=1 Tax=Acinetobacter sp. TaxID=472 RepID=UPI002584E979
MNKIYKLIWNARAQTWVVCSELGKITKNSNKCSAITGGLSTVLLASSIAISMGVSASTCGDGTTVATGGTCDLGIYNPRDNDGKVGQMIVTNGDTATLTGNASNIESGKESYTWVAAQDVQFTGDDPSGQESLNIGQKDQAVAVPDPITGNNFTVATYDSNKIVAGDWGTTSIRVGVDVGDDQYIDGRFATVSNGGTLIVNIGDTSQSTQASMNNIFMHAKQTELVKAEQGGHVEWVSKNHIEFGDDYTYSGGINTGAFTAKVPNYAGTFTGFDGKNYTVTNVDELKAYNEILISALQAGTLTSQEAYDAAFNQALLGYTDKTFTYEYTVTPGDDATQAQGSRTSLHVTGSGSTATIKNGAHIEQRFAPIVIDQGGQVTIEEGASVSGNGNDNIFLYDAGGSLTNYGVISAGYYAGDNYDTTQAGNYSGAYVEGRAVTVANGAKFDNYGIMNVAGFDYFGGASDNYAVTLTDSEFNNHKDAIINVAVSNNPTGGSVSGVIVGNNSRAINDGIIYVGRAAQYDKTDVVEDTENKVAQYAMHIANGANSTLINNGEITLGSKTQNATAIAVENTSGASVSNTGTINVNGAADGIPFMSVGILASNTADSNINNTGKINLTGVNGIGVKTVSNGNNSAKVVLGDSSIINVAGGRDVTSGTRNYGVWTEGQGTQRAQTDVGGQINLTGDGAIGVHARGNAQINVASSAVPTFNNGTDQIGFFIYGQDAAINVDASNMEVNTERSTLFRIAEGADLAASGLKLTTSGKDSVGVMGTGAGTVINTTGGIFNLTGDGSNAITVEGGASGLIDAGTTINLLGANSIAGIADGQKHDLAGNPDGAIDSSTLLTSSADLKSNQTGVTGYIVRNQATLDLTGDLHLSGADSTGVLSQGGIVNVSNSNVNVKGNAFVADGNNSIINLNNTQVLGSNNVLDVKSGTSQFTAIHSDLTGLTKKADTATSMLNLSDLTWQLTEANGDKTAQFTNLNLVDSRLVAYDLNNQANKIHSNFILQGNVAGKNAEIDMANGIAGETLTIQGNYTTGNNTWLMDSYLTGLGQ